MLFFSVVIIAIVLDQYTKVLTLRHLALGDLIPMGVFDIHHVHNRGAAFGMLQNSSALFVAVAVAVLAGMIIALPRIRRAEPLVAAALGAIAGGTIGNLIDRLRYGFVIDFIDFRWWPVFNVADSFICVGVGLLVWHLLTQSVEEPHLLSQAAEAAHLSSDSSASSAPPV